MPTDRCMGKTRIDAVDRFQKTWPNRVIRRITKVRTVDKNNRGDYTYRVTWHHRGEKPYWAKS